MDKVINNWLKLSDYDYKSAEFMLKSSRYLYVAFMCQQAVEKALKALFCKKCKNKTPPYTHNLIKLVKEIEALNYPKEYNGLPNFLNAYYIESRYNEDFEKLNKSIDKKIALEIYKKTGELLKWLKAKI